MEDLENIARNEPVWPGNVISHEALHALEKGKLVMRDDDGNVILSSKGQDLFHLWSRVPFVPESSRPVNALPGEGR